MGMFFLHKLYLSLIAKEDFTKSNLKMGCHKI